MSCQCQVESGLGTQVKDILAIETYVIVCMCSIYIETWRGQQAHALLWNAKKSYRLSDLHYEQLAC